MHFGAPSSINHGRSGEVYCYVHAHKSDSSLSLYWNDEKITRWDHSKSRLNFVKRLVKILIFWLICKINFANDRLISISLSFSASIVNL